MFSASAHAGIESHGSNRVKSRDRDNNLFFKVHAFESKSAPVGMEQNMYRGVSEASSMCNIMTNTLE